MSNPLLRFQEDVTGFLLSHTPLQYVSIVAVRPRTAGEAKGIQTKIDEALAGISKRNGKLGVSIIVSMPGVDKVQPNVRAIKGDMILAVDIIENLLLNNGAEGTGATAEEHALMVAGLLQHQTFDGGQPVVGDAKLITPLQEEVMDKKVVYRVTVRKALVGELLEKVAMPAIAKDGNLITLSCTTPGAAIYYTLDESFPGPGNAAALLYAAPFEIEVGEHVLRAAAFKNGLAGSHVINADVTGVA
jgi:hypothetical protein